jgi:hypothetical protein
MARSLIIHTQNWSLHFQWTVEYAVNNLSASSLVRTRGTGAEFYCPCLSMLPAAEPRHLPSLAGPTEHIRGLP